MSNFIFIYLFIFLSINCVTSFSSVNNAVSVFQNNNNHILAMVKDYTLIDLPVDNTNIVNEFSLNQYKDKEEKEKKKGKRRERKTEKKKRRKKEKRKHTR